MSETVTYALQRLELGWANEALNLLEQAKANERSNKERDLIALELGNSTFDEPFEFRITPFGHDLLMSV